MALRDELIEVVDDVRGMIDTDLGLRLVTVTVRRREWSGGEVGSGTPTDTDTVIEPRPKVTGTPPRRAYAEPGWWENGDRVVSKISATYTEADLGAGASEAGVEWLWLLDTGESTAEYLLQGHPEERFLGWTAHLRRRKRPRTR